MEIHERRGEDRFLQKGQYQRLEENIRNLKTDIPIVVVYAFDKRTRLGPFLFIDKTMIPAGARAIASSVYSAGFTNVRIVLQQWNPNFRTSKSKLNGKVPEILLISSMQIHSKGMYELISDAHKMKSRPLIIVGGPKVIYQPEHVFSKNRANADIAVTGEEYIILELIEMLARNKQGTEHIRETFERLKNTNELNDILGIVYKRNIEGKEVLINTGTQKLLKELGDLPNPLIGLSLVEPKHNKETLGKKPIPLNKIKKYAPVMSLVTSHGCVEKCSFCPIPSYNQRSIRTKSVDKLVNEIIGIVQETGITDFFGTDDSAFVNRVWLDEIMPAMADAVFTKGKFKGKKLGEIISYGTEATLRSVILNKDKLALARKAGFRFIWFGIEDLNAELVDKGQTPEKTKEIFLELRKNNICAMPMMIHYDEQPWTRNDGKLGLKETVEFLKNECKATSVQITYITPSIGSKGYAQHFNNGEVFRKVGDISVDDYLFDGNHVIATKGNDAYKKQVELLRAYALFYNPASLIKAIFKSRKGKSVYYDCMFQIFGNLAFTKSFFAMMKWLGNLKSGKLEKYSGLPVVSEFDVINADDFKAHLEIKSKIERIKKIPVSIPMDIKKEIIPIKDYLAGLANIVSAIEDKSAELLKLKEDVLKKISELLKEYANTAEINYADFNQKINELINDLSLISLMVIGDSRRYLLA